LNIFIFDKSIGNFFTSKWLLIKCRHINNDLKPLFMIKKVYVIIIAALISLGNIQAQDKSDRQPMPLFQSEELLNLDLQADFKSLFSVRDDSTNFPAKITFTDNNGLERTIDISIRSRGQVRREKDVCSFTPLRLNFPKSGTKNSPFEGQKTIKLVTHCNKSDNYEQNTIMEYLIYKAYNVLTDSSFRVRPAIINYVYAGDKTDTVRKFAFFIEREKYLADRLQGIEIETKKTNPDLLSPFQSCLMDIFQYMIGNTDYSTYDLHNVILISDSALRLPAYPVPYDFDWSGLVSAAYAVPHPVIGTEKVTERVYRGFKKEPFVVYHTIGIFNKKKEEIYRVFQNFPLLEDNEKKQAIKYLDDFFRIINNERTVQKEFFDYARVVHE
jgi:hypothetical protein